MRKINEIFYSIQGEGCHSGKPAIFIRFSGCNLKCPFCDTKHQNGVMMSDKEILDTIRQYPAELVVLTGGEPSFFIDEPFVQMLKNAGKYVAIETNGTHELPKNLDWVTVSPKSDFCENATPIINECDEVKAVFRFQANLSWYLNNFKAKYYFLQPCDMGDKKLNEEILNTTIAQCLGDPRWRISLQTQKILNVR